MRGNQGAVFKDPNLIGECVYFDDPLPGRVGNAVKIAAAGNRDVCPARQERYLSIVLVKVGGRVCVFL